IYNGVDTDVFQPVVRGPWTVVRDEEGAEGGQTEHATRNPQHTPHATAHGPRPTDHVVLSAARLVRWKGAEYLIEALPRLQTPGVEVWLAGEGPYQADLEALAQRLGVADRVRFMGNVPAAAMADLYHQVDVLAATSFVNETFGIAPAEAMASGLPVVASRF